MIDGALSWHHEHPDRQPEVAYAPTGALSDCERRIYGSTALIVGEQDFDGGTVGDVRIEFEIPSRPEADDTVAELDGQPVQLRLDGVDPDRGTRRGRIVLDDAWADGHVATLVLRSPTIERRADVQPPAADDTPPTSHGQPPESSSTSTTEN